MISCGLIKFLIEIYPSACLKLLDVRGERPEWQEETGELGGFSFRWFSDSWFYENLKMLAGGFRLFMLIVGLPRGVESRGLLFTCPKLSLDGDRGELSSSISTNLTSLEPILDLSS
jgi:hypothetical protein